MSAFRLLPSLLFAAAGLTQTFVVDASGAPGTDFTSIAAATSAVPSGSVLQVRAGTYFGFDIAAKSLTLNAEPGVVVQVSSSSLNSSWIRISNLAPQDRVVLRGLSWTGVGLANTGSLHATGCQGLILIDGLDLVGMTTTALSFDTCDRIVVRDCRLNGTGWTDLFLSNSHGVIENCRFGPGGPFSNTIGSGVRVIDGSLQVIDSRLGNAIAWVTPGSALAVQHADVRLLGTTVLSGSNTFTGSLGYGISGQGTVRLAPTVLFEWTSLNFAPGVTATPAAMPSMTSSPVAASGSTTDLQVRAEAGDLAAIFVALPGPRTLLPFFSDPSWQDLATLIPLAAGSTNSSGLFSQQVTMPPLSPFVMVNQAIALGPQTGFAITNPTFSSLH